MKLLALAALALTSACASLPPPPAGWFDCNWARMADLESAVAHRGMPRWAPMICGGDDPGAAVRVDAASKVSSPAAQIGK